MEILNAPMCPEERTEQIEACWPRHTDFEKSTRRRFCEARTDIRSEVLRTRKMTAAISE